MKLGRKPLATLSQPLRKRTVAQPLAELPLLVVGDPFFLARHRPLIDALRLQLGTVEELGIHERAVPLKLAYAARDLVAGRLWPVRRATLRACLARFRKEPATFRRVSRLAERTILRRRPLPKLILQIFSMSSPVGDALQIPYAHYLDMTMALVRRQWPEWAPFSSEARYRDWIALEGASYRGARRVFTFSESARRSVIDDYGARPERVVAVGAAGHYHTVATANRSYGSRSIMFNGSDFTRKGGDLALAAFRLVRKRYPDAMLTMVACAGLEPEPGVRALGNISRANLFALFDCADIVLAPTRFDGLPGFVVEAMSRGVVPVLSNVPPMPEIVRNEHEGFIASPSTPERLAELMCTLLADQSTLRSFGDAARARVTRDWNWDAVALKMIDALGERGSATTGERT